MKLDVGMLDEAYSILREGDGAPRGLKYEFVDLPSPFKGIGLIDGMRILRKS